MANINWQKMTALQVSNFMTFEKGQFDWCYGNDQSFISMADKQAEGVAYLWNLLGERKVAFLADEVGMGKTFQAIGVILCMLRQKPNAKVLVITPNKNICNHWHGEFNSFSRYHWKGKFDQTPKLGASESNLHNLTSSLTGTSTNVFFTTVHSFSGLASDCGDVNKVDYAKQVASQLHDKVLSDIGDQGFDLIVIDEAHYFRSIHGGSQKVAAAREFFGDGSKKIAQRVLLMTATPTHSSENDVANILGYFCLSEQLEGKDAQTLLSEYALRRFRLMQGREGRFYSKHDYRQETAMPVTFEGQPDAELFFGLYQRELVKRLKEARKKGHAIKQYLYGYLEGFESFGEQDESDSTEIADEDETDKSKDSFSRAADSDLLHGLSQEYFKCKHTYPEHPKYNALVDSFSPKELSHDDLADCKHLVFVRRIPSVKELTKRVNKAYDDLLGHRLGKVLDMNKATRDEWKDTGWSRRWLNIHFGNDDISENEEEDTSAVDDNQDDKRLRSRIAELFVVKRKGSGSIEETRNTICTNVASRFKKPENIFSLFLEPGSDHLLASYKHYYAHESNGKVRSLYSTAAFDSRMYRYVDKSNSDTEKKEFFDVQTVWGLIIPLLASSNRLKLEGWKIKDIRIVENFANYLKAGILFASPVIIEIFEWYICFDKKQKKMSSENRYKRFLKFVKPKLDDSCLLWYFNQAIETFEELCDKIERIPLNKYTHDWRSLKSLTSPAGYASGQSSNRERLILGFNSPFYPNVLVATSVFQEGVNLHMQCNNIHHYGIAGNAGDNEQRVGRIDRLFGKVNRLLKEEGDVTLNINFPYLVNSFDEDQLASFLERKYLAEHKLDACLQDKKDNTIGDNKSEHWKSYLKSPAIGNSILPGDPYPARDI